jgi:hypothetical protein
MTTGCHDATLIITVPAVNPDMTDGLASSQYLRAFVQLPEDLLAAVEARFGVDNVAAMIHHFAQKWTDTFGIVNHEHYIAGARENGSSAFNTQSSSGPFPPDAERLPPRKPQSSYCILVGGHNDDGNDLTPVVSGQAFTALTTARRQLQDKLATVSNTLSSTREELDVLSIKLADSEDDAAACRVEIGALVDDKRRLLSDSQALRTELEAVTIECTALVNERDIIQASLAKLNVQFAVARSTNQNLREENKALDSQLEVLANSATRFHHKASTVIVALQDEVKKVHERCVELFCEVLNSQGESYEMASHEVCCAEGGPDYSPTPVALVSAPNVDIDSASIAGGALMQLARHVQAASRASKPTVITKAELNQFFEPGVPLKPVDRPLPAIVANVLASYNQPEYVANVVSSTLSLPHTRFRDMYTLLRIQSGSPLEQDLTEVLKQALGIDFLPE